ncbi:MAG: hypothetical protein JNM90_10765 [Burkholderiales bacterium]|nr:hypothetical protein [Burkholderiales bacterium]
MLEAILKLVGRRPDKTAPPPLECVFSLNPHKRKLYLLDLKAILRKTEARLALPNACNLETTIRRNRERIRIPYDAMLPLVRELLTVRHRIPPKSPLMEILTAVPGLINTVLTAQLPTSSIMDSREVDIRLPGIPRAEQDAEVARIRDMIARRKPAAPRTRPAPAPAPAVAPAAAPPGAPAHAASPDRAAPAAMSASDRRAFLSDSAEAIEAVALSTQELSDEDLAGYVDLCMLNGEEAKVVSMLAERVAEQPRAWAWIRLLEVAEAIEDPRLADLRRDFVAWAGSHHPQLMPDLRAEVPGELFHGVSRAALRELERGELVNRLDA